MNKKMLIVAITVFLGLSFLAMNNRGLFRPTITETAPKAVEPQKNILPNQKRIEEIVAETKEIKSKAEKAAQERRVKKETEDALGRISEMREKEAAEEVRKILPFVQCGIVSEETCRRQLTGLIKDKDVAASLIQLNRNGVEIIMTPAIWLGMRTYSISYATDGTIGIYYPYEISEIKEFLGLPPEEPKNQQHQGTYSEI